MSFMLEKWFGWFREPRHYFPPAPELKTENAPYLKELHSWLKKVEPKLLDALPSLSEAQERVFPIPGICSIACAILGRTFFEEFGIDPLVLQFEAVSEINTKELINIPHRTLIVPTKDEGEQIVDPTYYQINSRYEGVLIIPEREEQAFYFYRINPPYGRPMFLHPKSYYIEQTSCQLFDDHLDQISLAKHALPEEREGFKDLALKTLQNLLE